MKRIKVTLDCDISHRLTRVLDGLYGYRGFEFSHVTGFAAPTSEDDHWADTFKRFGGHVVLSGDGQIAYKPHKAIAFIDNGFISFFIASPWQHMRGHLEAAHLVHAWPEIESKIRAGETGRCWRVPCDVKMAAGRYADLRLTPVNLEPLVIPDAVLEEARKKRSPAACSLHQSRARGWRERGPA